ncbi:DNA polymerase III subunit beta [Candidatus Kaiserbacteria bacterium]|nr:DNA polymerase III subunit beta [Candidatus Kaiserbacteria bacterium]
MRASTTKEKILGGVLIAERLTGKKETLPTLSCILLEVSGKTIVLRATNLEAGVEVVVPGEVDEKGIIAVPAIVLSQTLRSTHGDKVTLSAEDGNLLIESRGTKTVIKGMPHDEFPTLSPPTDGKGENVSREQLLRGLQAVSYAASPSMIRPELGSIYLLVGATGVICVATDSFRLAEKMIGSSERGEEVLLPLRHALELSHVLEHAEGAQVKLTADESQLSVSADGVRFISRIVDGTFPNYKEIVPKIFSTEATVLKSDLSEMLKKARVFSGNDQHIGFHVYPSRKIFSATARSADIGEMSDSLDAALSGEDLDINFHIGYLADCLPTIESDSIILGFSGAGKPLVIRGVSDPSFTYLVMPLNR